MAFDPPIAIHLGLPVTMSRHNMANWRAAQRGPVSRHSVYLDEAGASGAFCRAKQEVPMALAPLVAACYTLY